MKRDFFFFIHFWKKIVGDGPVHWHTYILTHTHMQSTELTHHRQYTAVTHEHIAHPHRQRSSLMRGVAQVAQLSLSPQGRVEST